MKIVWKSQFFVKIAKFGIFTNFVHIRVFVAIPTTSYACVGGWDVNMSKTVSGMRSCHNKHFEVILRNGASFRGEAHITNIGEILT